MRKKKVLIVEDSRYMQELIRSQLPPDYEVVALADNQEDALKAAKAHTPDLITMDNILPDTFGADVTAAIRSAGITSKILVISSLSSEVVMKQQLDKGADGYLAKPFSDKELQKALDQLTF